MDELNMNNLLSAEEINNLFEEDSNTKETQESSPESEEQTQETKSTTEEIDVNDLFTETSESVGSEEYSKQQEGTETGESGSSPKNNFYSSIAKALKVDGVLPDLADDIADNIKSPEDFASAIEEQIQAKLDERQKRIDKALSDGVEEDVVRNYEKTLSYLDSITEEQLNEEGDAGEDIRKRLIFQDLINKGYSQEEAVEEIKEIFENGTDIKKATRALASNKDFFKNSYNKVLNEAKEAADKEKHKIEQQAEEFKKSILEDKKVFGDLELDKATRQRIFDTISKPIHKDKDSGKYYTALQKYEAEHKNDFLKYVGLVFTLTDGFKNLDGLVKTKVNKEVKKGLRELENTLNNTSRTSDGNLRFVSGVADDPNSFIGKWDLDV